MKISASQFLQELQNLEIEKLQEVKGLGPIIIENLTIFVKSENFEKLQKKLEELEKLDKGLELDFGKIKPQKIEQNEEKSIEENTRQDNHKNNEKFEKYNQSNQIRQIVCITGTFEITRNQIVIKLEENNFEVTDSLTKNVTILLAGQKSGSKLQKALKMGIKIVQNLDELI